MGRYLRWAVIGLWLGLTSARAGATTGGDTRVEVLGWAPDEGGAGRDDADARTVYWATLWGGEGTQLDVFSQRLEAGATPTHLRKLGTDDEAVATQRLAKLRRRLAKLAKLPRAARKAITLETRVDQKKHVVLHQTDERTRFKLHVTVRTPDGQVGEVDLVSYENARVRVVAALAVPDGGGTLVVLRFLGDPSETVYQTDAVVLARPPTS